MKYILYILTLWILISCNQNRSKQNELNLTVTNTENTENTESRVKDTIHKSNISFQNEKNKSILREIQPDYFEINQKEFKKYEADNSRWFINISGTDKLYFAPYTDYSITTAILTNEKLKENEVGLLRAEGIKIDDLKRSIKIENIKSKKGVTIGLTIKQVTEIFGQPDEIITENNRKSVKWNFTMKEENSDNNIGGLKPFIHNGLEFTVEMEFFNDKIVQVIYRYQVP